MKMKAIVYERYGPPDVLQLREVERPAPRDDEVLVKVRAASVNDGDSSLVKGSPFIARLSSGLLKPRHSIPGGDVAGQVEVVGRNVTKFTPGDEVFGDLGESGFGAFAEYVSVPENVLVLKPANTTFEEAAALPQYAVVALQGLRDNGQIRQGQNVLINGASGGVGTFAVQIAKSYGAEVTGVCSAKNMDLVRSIGADHVFDYTREDFTRKEQRYDLILDNVANRPISDYTHALSPDGRYVSVKLHVGALILGPLISMTGRRKASQLVHKPNVRDLVIIRELVEAGRVAPVIDRHYRLSEVAKAFREYDERHPSGKVVITMEHDAQGKVD